MINTDTKFKQVYTINTPSHGKIKVKTNFPLENLHEFVKNLSRDMDESEGDFYYNVDFCRQLLFLLRTNYCWLDNKKDSKLKEIFESSNYEYDPKCLIIEDSGVTYCKQNVIGNFSADYFIIVDNCIKRFIKVLPCGSIMFNGIISTQKFEANKIIVKAINNPESVLEVKENSIFVKTPDYTLESDIKTYAIPHNLTDEKYTGIIDAGIIDIMKDKLGMMKDKFKSIETVIRYNNGHRYIFNNIYLEDEYIFSRDLEMLWIMRNDKIIAEFNLKSKSLEVFNSDIVYDLVLSSAVNLTQYVYSDPGYNIVTKIYGEKNPSDDIQTNFKEINIKYCDAKTKKNDNDDECVIC